MKAITHAGIATLGWAWTSRTKGILCRKNLCLKSRRAQSYPVASLTRFSCELARGCRAQGYPVNSCLAQGYPACERVAHKGIL